MRISDWSSDVCSSDLLVIPAQMATPEAINFMAKHGRGLICLSMTQKRCQELGLRLMRQKNQSRHQTAFTTPIQARHGVTMGISASDSARTTPVATAPSTEQHDTLTTGPLLPPIGLEGGDRVRTANHH